MRRRLLGSPWEHIRIDTWVPRLIGFPTRQTIASQLSGVTHNTETSNKSTHHHMNPRIHGSDLNDVTNDEHDDTEGKTLSSTEPVRCATNQLDPQTTPGEAY